MGEGGIEKLILKKSSFEEITRDSNFGDHLEPIDNKVKDKIFENIKLFAERLETALNEEDEELKYKIIYYAPSSKKQIDSERRRLVGQDEIIKKAWQLEFESRPSPKKRDLEKEFGPEFGEEFENLPKDERIEKLTDALIDKELKKRIDYKTSTNITIYRKKKGSALIISYYSNLNITEDGIYVKGSGLISSDEIIGEISSYLREHIINKEF